MSLIVAASAFLPAVTALLDKVIPDPEAKARAQLELIRLEQEGAFRDLDVQARLAESQAAINQAEAAQGGAFRGGWRPAAGWVCVLGLGYEFIVRPLLPWVLSVSGAPDVPPLPSLDAVLFELLFGMLGLGAMRSVERHQRIRALGAQSK